MLPQGYLALIMQQHTWMVRGTQRMTNALIRLTCTSHPCNCIPFISFYPAGLNCTNKMLYKIGPLMVNSEQFL